MDGLGVGDGVVGFDVGDGVDDFGARDVADGPGVVEKASKFSTIASQSPAIVEADAGNPLKLKEAQSDLAGMVHE